MLLIAIKQHILGMLLIAVKQPIPGMLLIAVMCFGMVSANWNVAFSAGSSQHGSARRASVASNCVVPRYLVSPSWVHLER